MTTEQNTYAIIGMLSVVITLYALKESHTHYLPDLFGLALALAAPRQSLALCAVLLVALIRHTRVGAGLADIVPDWLHGVVLPIARNMSSAHEDYTSAEESYQRRISESRNEDENSEISRRVAENEEQKNSSPRVEIMAQAVAAGMIGLTEATRLLAGVQGGKKYQTASRLLKLEIERQRDHYVPLNEYKQQATRN